MEGRVVTGGRWECGRGPALKPLRPQTHRLHRKGIDSVGFFLCVCVRVCVCVCVFYFQSGFPTISFRAARSSHDLVRHR